MNNENSLNGHVYKRKIVNSSSGFTLVELLAVLSIFVAVSVFISSIILATLRNDNKTNAITAVQTNGNYAINQMSRLIRSARSLDSSVSCGTIASPVSAPSIAVIDPDGQTTTFSCTTDNSNPPRPIIASNGATLIDPNQVLWENCSFTCGRNSASDYPEIGISFSLKYKAIGNSSFADQTASSSAILFTTTVIMRNLER